MLALFVQRLAVQSVPDSGDVLRFLLREPTLIEMRQLHISMLLRFCHGLPLGRDLLWNNTEGSIRIGALDTSMWFFKIESVSRASLLGSLLVFLGTNSDKFAFRNLYLANDFLAFRRTGTQNFCSTHCCSYYFVVGCGSEKVALV